MNILSLLLRKAAFFYRGLQYRITSHKVPIRENYILLEAMQGKCYGCNIKPIYQELLSNPDYSGYYFIWSLRNSLDYTELRKQPRTTVIEYHSSEYRYALASSKYWIASSGFPEYVKKKKDQIFIQTWHGTPLKKLGCDIKLEGNAISSVKQIHKRYRAQGKQVDYFCAPSDYVKEKLTSAFDLKRLKVQPDWIETGYPRNDILYQYTSKDVLKIKNILRIPLDKKVILYAPTFRDNQYNRVTGYQFVMPFHISKMQKILGDDHILLLRKHSMVSSDLDVPAASGFLFDVSHYEDISELYLISDLLITDYSSTFFDYANLRRPIIFYHNDIEEYEEEIRGIYLNIEDLPGVTVQTEEALIQEIKGQLGQKFLVDDYQNFLNIYAGREGASSSRSFVEKCIPSITKRSIAE